MSSPQGSRLRENQASTCEQAATTDASTSTSQDTSPKRTPSLSNIDKSAHRQSFAENLRNAPQSPRHRHSSFTQAAVQELLNHPPARQRHTISKFVGRDWGEISIGELVSPEDVKWVDVDSTVEDATKVSEGRMMCTSLNWQLTKRMAINPGTGPLEKPDKRHSCAR